MEGGVGIGRTFHKGSTKWEILCGSGYQVGGGTLWKGVSLWEVLTLWKGVMGGRYFSERGVPSRRYLWKGVPGGRYFVEESVMWIQIDSIRIQVKKITKFSKHLLIFKSKKIGMS